MKKVGLSLILLVCLSSGLVAQPVLIETALLLAPDEPDSFMVQIPDGYNPELPPPLFTLWHGLGGSHRDLLQMGFLAQANDRGWIAACHKGPNDRHWNTRGAQDHCRVMLDWIMENYPFDRDSLYMIGGSMGGAAGLVWHNNNCGLSDYVIAAAVGGSPILDCELRQQQYLDSGHVNNSMIAAFGGLNNVNDSIDFEYHRYSAIHFADTSQSMHFNGLNLPAYVTWGTSDSNYLAEWFAYGRPAQAWDSLREAGGAVATVAYCSGIDAHGYQVMVLDSVFDWLSGFSANRYPQKLSINADEDGEYYWTRVTLADTAHSYGRYGADYSIAERRLDLNLIRNVAAINVEFAFPWWDYDSLRGHWINHDSIAIPEVTVSFTGLLTSVLEVRRNGVAFPFSFSADTLTLTVPPSGQYLVLFDPLKGPSHNPSLPHELQLLSAYPNPFNTQVVLKIASDIFHSQTIRLYDITGRLARSINVQLAPGVHSVSLSGNGLPSGIYFVTLPGSSQRPLKIVLLK